MSEKSVLVIASGQCGVSVFGVYKEKYEISNYVLFNSAPDNKRLEDEVNLLASTDDGQDGSGRNPQITLEKLIPPNEEMIRARVMEKFEVGKTKSVVLISSAGGGTGAILNHWIIQNILLPLKDGTDFNVYAVLVFGFRAEKNPVMSNSCIQLTRFYYPLMDRISVIPFVNDEVFVPGGAETYRKTNEAISETIHKIIDFEDFAGEQKENGFNTLDRNEFFRMTAPSQGFISYRRVEVGEVGTLAKDEHIFKVLKSTSMLVMFRTSKNRSLDMDAMNKIAEIFPIQKRIVAEGISTNGRNYIELICNGIPIPPMFAEMKDAIHDAQLLKRVEKRSEDSNAKKIKKISGGMSTKKMFEL